MQYWGSIFRAGVSHHKESAAEHFRLNAECAVGCMQETSGYFPGRQNQSPIGYFKGLIKMP